MKQRIKARPHLLHSEFRAAIALCCRPQGATSRDLADAMHVRRLDDAATRLRQHLRTFSNFSLTSQRMNADDRLRCNYIGPGRIYRIRLKYDDEKNSPGFICSRVAGIQRRDDPQVSEALA